MRALTVRQPWAWAIVHGGKDVENRTRNLAGSYRGPVAIQAGLTFDDDGGRAWPILRHPDYADAPMTKGAFIGVADLVSVHHDSDHGPHRCSSWAQAGEWHLMLANARPLPKPIPVRGMLGLWTPPADVLEQLQAVV